jgi:hypothetical protein
MENGPFTDGLPVQNGDFLYLYQRVHGNMELKQKQENASC